MGGLLGSSGGSIGGRDGRKLSDINRCLELNTTKEVGGACGVRGRAEPWRTHTPIPIRYWSKVPGCRAEGTCESKVAHGSQQSRGQRNTGTDSEDLGSMHPRNGEAKGCKLRAPSGSATRGCMCLVLSVQSADETFTWIIISFNTLTSF